MYLAYNYKSRYRCVIYECIYYNLVHLLAVLQLKEQHCDNISEKSAQVWLFGDTVAVQTVKARFHVGKLI